MEYATNAFCFKSGHAVHVKPVWQFGIKAHLGGYHWGDTVFCYDRGFTVPKKKQLSTYEISKGHPKQHPMSLSFTCCDSYLA
jgi:hypothetical protein